MTAAALAGWAALLGLPGALAANLANGRRAFDDSNLKAADFFIPSLPGLPTDRPLVMYGGHIPSTPPLTNPSKASNAIGPSRGNSHLYFLLLRANHQSDRKRLVIWFNGGPGCSSFDGSMMEIGAWRVDGKGGLKWVKDGGSWNEYVDVLFLDQPVGTGFSYADTNAYVHNSKEAGDQVVHFLKNFYQIFPEFKEHDTYLAGESYAGQWIPWIANSILSTTEIDTRLKGIAIGNGAYDPRHQAGSTVEMGKQAGLLRPGDEATKKLDEHVARCMASLEKDKDDHTKLQYSDCDILTDMINLTLTTVNGKKMCVNSYDIRLVDEYPACGMNWPPDLSAVYDYLRRDDVKRALHAEARQEAWTECNDRVGSALTGQGDYAGIDLFPTILSKNVAILVFAGDQDIICNHIGVEWSLGNLTWKGEKGMGDAPIRDWHVNNSYAGTWQTSRNLTYVKVANASHMVGFDVPVESHDMMLRFMGVDVLSAAGPSARIPSRLGDEPDRMLVLSGGGGNGNSGPPMIVGGKSEEEVKDEAKWEAYYNAGSAALAFMLVVLALAAFFWCRARRARRRRGRRFGGGGGGDGGGAVRLPGGKEGGEDPHELDELVVDRPDEEEDDGDDRRDSYHPTHRTDKKNGGVQERDSEVMFDVGEDEDEEGGPIITPNVPDSRMGGGGA